MNFTTDQSYNYAVLMSSIHVRKSEKSKNSCLNLLYFFCYFLAICSNYLILMMSTSLACRFRAVFCDHAYLVIYSVAYYKIRHMIK